MGQTLEEEFGKSRNITVERVTALLVEYHWTVQAYGADSEEAQALETVKDVALAILDNDEKERALQAANAQVDRETRIREAGETYQAMLGRVHEHVDNQRTKKEQEE